MNAIKRVPVPACGVMLGLAALGNLLQSYSEGLRWACGMAAAVLLALILLKLILFPKAVGEDLKNPIMASTAAAFPMGLMLLSVYVKPFLGGGAFAIWGLAVLLHVVLILYFSARFLVKLSLSKVFASWYIVYVGIVAAAVSAPAYGQQALGMAAFWFGFVCLLCLLVLVTARYAKLPVPEPAKPLICIYTAPASLCVAGYLQSAETKSLPLLLGMFALACVLYVFSLVKAAACLRLPFYPSYAAFTFPFVISAIAAKQTAACLANMGHPVPALQYVVLAETVIAAALTVYAFVRFLGTIFGKNANG